MGKKQGIFLFCILPHFHFEELYPVQKLSENKRDVLFVHSCTVRSLRPYIHSYCYCHQSQISQNVYWCFRGSEKHNHQEQCRKETSKNVVAWIFIIKERSYHQQQSVCQYGGKLLQFCISLQGSLQVFDNSLFLFKTSGFGKQCHCLAKLFRPDGVNLSRPTFVFGGCGRLLDVSLWNTLFRVNLIFRNGDSAIASWQGEDGETGTFRR